MRHLVVISIALGSSIGPVAVSGSAENCTGPRTYDEYWNMLLGPGSGYQGRTRPSMAKAAKDKTQFADMAPAEDVQVQLNINQVNHVEDVTQSFKIFVIQSLVWQDDRLNQLAVFRPGLDKPLCMQKNFVNLGWDAVNGTLWMPDVYAVNAAHDNFLKGGCLLHINGLVICTTYRSYVLTCDMDFTKMPFDEQHCHIEMRVFAGTATEVFLHPPDAANALKLPTKQIGTVEWKVKKAGVDSSVLTTDANTKESRLLFQLILQRESGFYVKEVMIPTMGIMLICWLSFFVSKAAVPARCAVTVIAFLTLTNQSSGITSRLPRLATDVWLLTFLGGSQWFAFVTILEYGLVNTLTRYEDALNKAKAAAEKKEKEEAEKELKSVEAGQSAAVEKPAAEGELLQRKAFTTDGDVDVDSGPPGQQIPRESTPPQAGKKESGKKESDNAQQNQQKQQVDTNELEDAPSQRRSQSARVIQSGVKSTLQADCVKFLLSTKDGRMRLKDDDVDLFARWAYPIAYIIFFLAMIGQV